jgi:hypothetical protein
MNTFQLLRDRQDEKRIIKDMNNRELFKDYRLTVKHYNEVIEHYNTGSDCHLGEPMRRVVSNAKWSLNAMQEEIMIRGFKPANICKEPIIARLTESQLEAQAEAKQLERMQREQDELQARNEAREQPFIDAMNKLCVFALNYNHNFIAEAFKDSHLIEHFQSKFHEGYSRCTAYGAMIYFWTTLDTENRKTLMRYILASDMK